MAANHKGIDLAVIADHSNPEPGVGVKMNFVVKYGKFSVGIICALLLNGCGGDSDSGATPASITSVNGEEIALSAYQGSESGQAFGAIFASATDVERPARTSAPAPLLTTLTFSLLQTIANTDATTTYGTPLSRAVETTVNPPVLGSCGGTAQSRISADDVTGDFSGLVVFEDYCDAGVTMDGGLGISGNGAQMSLTISSLSISSGDSSFTSDGSMKIDFGRSFLAPDGSINTDPRTTPITVIVNMKTRDGGTGLTFQVEDFIIHTLWTETGLPDKPPYFTFTMAGRFIHPSHGYVEITTPAPFRINEDGDWPISGIMMATGANGSRARLDVISPESYQIDIYESGNSTIPDYTSTSNWPLP